MSKDHGQVGFGHRSDHGRFSRIHLNVGWGRSHCARQSETSKAPDSLAKQKRPNNAIDRSLHPRHAGCEAPGPPGFRPGHCGRSASGIRKTRNSVVDEKWERASPGNLPRSLQDSRPRSRVRLSRQSRLSVYPVSFTLRRDIRPLPQPCEVAKAYIVRGLQKSEKHVRIGPEMAACSPSQMSRHAAQLYVRSMPVRS